MSLYARPASNKKPGSPSLSLSKPPLFLTPVASSSNLARNPSSDTASPASHSSEDSKLSVEESKQRIKQLQQVIEGLNLEDEQTDAGKLKTDCLRLVASDMQDLGRVGEGSAGEVRKVLHRPTGLIMARKTMTVSPNPDIHKQILRELSFNIGSHSPHIVNYYGAYLEEGDSTIAICMEYCDGGSLDAIYKQIKKRNGRTGEKILGKIAEAVLKGLIYLHDRKIIHRDIKPSNIVVTKNGMIKLCDFGVSGELINSMAKTFVGTSYYMAPERIMGAMYNWSSDIWSLGLTIHEIASNKFPFPPDGEGPLGPIELLTYITKMQPPELKDDPDAGIIYKKAIKDFLRCCLEKDPARRPNPEQLLEHPWIKKSETREVDLAKWIKDVWEWS